MKKSTIAAVAAAAMFGFGAVGSAMADTTISGFADINYNAFHSDAEEGTFQAAGEVDLTAGDDSAMVRIDLDILNALNNSAQADVPSGTSGLGVDVEQLNVNLKLTDVVGLTAGIFNSPFGREGQDATDLNFAANGLLWNYVPSNMAGALAGVTVNDQISGSVGYINSWPDLAAVGDSANDVVAMVHANIVDGVTLHVGYLTDSTEAMNGDMIDAYLNLGLVENLDVAVEFLSADPATGSAGFDSGYGIELGYNLGKFSVNGRYEAATYEGTGNDQTEYSLAANAHMSDNCVVRADFTSHTVDTVNSDDTLTIQMVHSF